MSWQTELQSWLSPQALKVANPPTVGQRAPQTERVRVPATEGKATVITFLRHCGCPFAEKTFLSLRDAASSNPAIQFIAVSHSDQEATDRWLEGVGGAGNVDVIVDTERTAYAAWGLGVASLWHVLSPGGLYAVYKLGKEEGIWNRPTESGTRWQTSGSFAVDGGGILRWAKPAQSADEVPTFEEAVAALRDK